MIPLSPPSCSVIPSRSIIFLADAGRLLASVGRDGTGDVTPGALEFESGNGSGLFISDRRTEDSEFVIIDESVMILNKEYKRLAF